MKWRWAAFILPLLQARPSFALNPELPAALFVVSSAPPKPRPSRAHAARNIALAQATGTVTRYTSEHALTPPPRNRIVELVQPQRLQAPNFATDLRAAIMTQELLDDLNNRIRQQAGAVSTASGFYDLNNGFYALSRDGRVTRPYGMTYEQELAVRKDMAAVMKRYVLIKGVPAFFRSRQQARAFAHNYDQVMAYKQMVKVDLDFSTPPPPGAPAPSTPPWKYSLGVDPVKFVSWVRATQGERWVVESNNNLQHPNAWSLRARRNWRRDWMEIVYDHPPRHVYPKYVHVFTPAVNGTLAVNVPLRSAEFARDLFTQVAMSYSF